MGNRYVYIYKKKLLTEQALIWRFLKFLTPARIFLKEGMLKTVFNYLAVVFAVASTYRKVETAFETISLAKGFINTLKSISRIMFKTSDELDPDYEVKQEIQKELEDLEKAFLFETVTVSQAKDAVNTLIRFLVKAVDKSVTGIFRKIAAVWKKLLEIWSKWSAPTKQKFIVFIALLGVGFVMAIKEFGVKAKDVLLFIWRMLVNAILAGPRALIALARFVKERAIRRKRDEESYSEEFI